jgi:hypothetical protein
MQQASPQHDTAPLEAHMKAYSFTSLAREVFYPSRQLHVRHMHLGNAASTGTGGLFNIIARYD